MCVCVCVCVLQALGRFREGINGQICLKFGTLIAWVNPWGSLFSFFENFIFLGPGDSVLDPKWTKNLWGALGSFGKFRGCLFVFLEMLFLSGKLRQKF